MWTLVNKAELKRLRQVDELVGEGAADGILHRHIDGNRELLEELQQKAVTVLGRHPRIEALILGTDLFLTELEKVSTPDSARRRVRAWPGGKSDHPEGLVYPIDEYAKTSEAALRRGRIKAAYRKLTGTADFDDADADGKTRSDIGSMAERLLETWLIERRGGPWLDDMLARKSGTDKTSSTGRLHKLLELYRNELRSSRTINGLISVYFGIL